MKFYFMNNLLNILNLIHIYELNNNIFHNIFLFKIYISFTSSTNHLNNKYAVYITLYTFYSKIDKFT